MRGLLLAATAETAIITWRDLSAQKMLPMPSDYVAVALFYGGLGLLPAQAAGAASLLGWGMVVATFLNLWNPSTPLKLVLPGGAQTTGTPPAPGTGLVALGGGQGSSLPNTNTNPAPNPPTSVQTANGSTVVIGSGGVVRTVSPGGVAYPVPAR